MKLKKGYKTVYYLYFNFKGELNMEMEDFKRRNINAHMNASR